MSRTRDTAAANEDKDIHTIVDAINARSAVGIRILEAFKASFDAEITAARLRKGSRKHHYDFEVQVHSGEWKKVEHKGSQLYVKPSPEDAPWKAGVQFHNGGCEKYSIARKYAQTWYTMYIASDLLRNEFGILAPTPSFDEWFAKDCRTQADPKTAFGKELKYKVREARGPKASLLEKRAAVLAALEITNEEKRVFMEEVSHIAKDVLSNKDYWLSIHGNLDGDFYVNWYPQFTIDSIHDVVLKKNLDLELTFVCSNNFKFNGILRWGKGAGFSCLRVDLK